MGKTQNQQNYTRRDFLKKSSIAVVGAAAAVTVGSAVAIAASEKKAKVQYGVLMDLRSCTGCNTCSISCKAESNVRLGAFRTSVTSVETGRYPKVKKHFIPIMCNHCENASCVRVCPTGATHKLEDGIVAITKDECIGCRRCEKACPYGARYFNSTDDKSSSRSRVPDTVDGCDMCLHRVNKGLVPSCVNACPNHARIFGNINDPHSEISQIIAKNVVKTRKPKDGCSPHVFYVGVEKDAAVIGILDGGR